MSKRSDIRANLSHRLRNDAKWPRRAALVMVLDIVCVLVSYLLALLLRFDFAWTQVPEEYLLGYRILMPATVALVVLTFWAFRLYHSIWSYASVNEVVSDALAWALDSAIMPLVSQMMGVSMPVSYWFIGGFLGFLSTTGLRFSYRLARLLRNMQMGSEGKSVMVVGAGECGRVLIREIRQNPQLGMHVVCVIDDNEQKHGRYIEGVQIVGDRNDIMSACAHYDIAQIIFAIPSCSVAERKAILDLCAATRLPVQAIPGIYQLVDGQVAVSKLREVRLEDLLGREPVVVDESEVRAHIEGRVVLVTGGGGSIGSELCRQIAENAPRQLVIFDIYENNAYQIQQELLRRCPELNLVTLIGSVRDERRVRSVFATYRPEIVFHAAAHKHVPLMEDSPHESIKNNVLGTLWCARAALDFGCERFVLISTDKAVNPTNIMGASKRLCEMVVQMINRKAEAQGADCEYVAVRFGNVLGSNGSVVPLFEQQIAEGGPVTVTDPRITRYFMTIPEAVSLVLQSMCYARGGEIFVLDMGEPVHIDDMARKLIRLAGYEPDRDIPVVYTGLRPGEKLYEERLMAEEGLRRTANKLISIARPIEMDDDVFERRLIVLEWAANDEESDICSIVGDMVPTYHVEESA